jgi:microcystin degradation protein MlrC
MTTRVAIGGIFHETNTFAAPTALEDFTVVRGKELLDYCAGTRTYLGGMLDECELAGATAIPTLYAEATPSGLIARDAIDALLAELVERVIRAQADAVLLSLHGAGVAEACDSIEDYICSTLREQLGSEVPLVATLDLHGNLTGELTDLCTGLFVGRLNPHTDQHERGTEAARCALAVVDGAPRPYTVIEPIPIVMALTATSNPLLSAVNALGACLEADPDVLSARLVHGFAYADLPHMGTSAVAVGANRDAAKRAAAAISALVWDRRQELRLPGLSAEEAVARAKAARPPVLINEYSDNTGAGAPGDGTHLLRALVDSGTAACFSHIHDPETVRRAADAGVGARIEVQLGGHSDTLHGEPLAAEAEVLAIADGKLRVKSEMGRGEPIDLGLVCTLRIGLVDVLVTSGRRQTLDDGWFIKGGIDIESYPIIALKSSQHFRAYFQDRVSLIITADPPGLSNADVSAYQRSRLVRKLWPLAVDATYSPTRGQSLVVSAEEST